MNRVFLQKLLPCCEVVNICDFLDGVSIQLGGFAICYALNTNILVSTL